MNYQVKFISKRWTHHSPHSGYDQLVSRLGSPIASLDSESLREKWIPGRIAIRLASRSGVDHYSHLAFYDEWAAIRDHLGRRGKSIYHILYGDDSYRYLGTMGQWTGATVVASYHLPPDNLRLNLKSVDHLRKLHALIVVGSNQLSFFEPIVGTSRLFLVPHGVDTNFFRPKQELGFHPDGYHCLFVGLHRRDFQVLREVIQLIGRRNEPIRFTLVLGQAEQTAFGGVDNVEVLSAIPEAQLLGLYQQADLLLQPLQESTANNAILEGMACGLPVVATDIGAVRDYMDESCGELVTPHDTEAMAAAILRLLADEAGRQKKAAAARAQALKFDWAIVAEQLAQIYQRILP